MWLVLIWSHREPPHTHTHTIISPSETPTLPLQTFIPVLFNLAERLSRWKRTKGRSKWIVLGDRGIISAAKQSLHLFRSGDLRPPGQRGCKPRGQTKPISEVVMEKSHWQCAWAREGQAVLLYSHNRDHTWHMGQFSALLLKWRPIQVLRRPSVSLLKPKNKDWMEQSVFIALCSHCRWLRAEWDLWKDRAGARENTAQLCDWLRAQERG